MTARCARLRPRPGHACLLVSLLGAVLVPAAAPDPAQSASRLFIRGAGFGHGVGMSQWGAYGFARRGREYRAILRHYYTGTALGPAPAGRTVRVLLRSGGSSSFTGARRAAGRRLDPSATYTATRRSATRVALRSASGRLLLSTTAPLRVLPGGRPLTLLGPAANGRSGGSYRGALEFRPSGSGLIAVNAVSLEAYVRGVVPVESPPSWPAEALKAQAVAARSYAITTGGGAAGYDQFADTRSQVYGGVAVEEGSTDAAVSATRGEVVTYQGTPVTTFFFSTSGGRTENVENSFSGSAPKPWLKSVRDPYDGSSPKHRWGPLRLTLGQARGKLGSLVKGSFRGVDVVRRGRSPRVIAADVIGSRGRTRVTGATLRARFGLFDTWAFFTVIRTGAKPPPLPDGDAPVGDEPAGGGDPTGGAAPARAALRRSAAPRAVLSGAVRPARRGTTAAVQLRRGARWDTVASVRLGPRGRYELPVSVPGRYRVRHGALRGPSVRVR